MIIGFLGKGGSGKSTLSTAMVHFLHAQKNNIVLALDADYNMDLSYNLDVPENIKHLGDSAKHDMKTCIGVDQAKLYPDIVLEKTDAQFFSLSPLDTFTKTYTREVKPNLHIMSVGPHTDSVLTGRMCSHGLGALLKVYLPLMKLADTEHVIVDEKAGTDSVGTGVQTGFDFAVIAVEPTVHSMKAGKQIASVLEKSKTPYGFVVNKCTKETDMAHIEQELGQKPIGRIGFTESPTSTDMKSIYEHIATYHMKHGDTRLERSVKKFIENRLK
jgi:CO dehydrogenase nickel-insertion accessory protein CooC1